MGHYGNAPKMEVSCGVENCYFNQNNMCHADSLRIDTMSKGKTVSSDGTCCITFKNNK